MADCPKCYDRGFIIEDDGGVGRATRCECFTSRRAEKRLEIWKGKLRDAGLPPFGIESRFGDATLSSYEIVGSAHDKQGLSRALATAQRFCDDFLDTQERSGFRRSGLLFAGPPGSGKTHLAISILKELVERYNVLGVCLDYTQFLSRLRASYESSEDSTSAYLRIAQEAELLVLDELGAQRPTPHTLETLYLIVNGRYTANLPTIFTTNYRLEGDAAQPSSLRSRVPPHLISRLYEMATVVTFPAFDYRREVRRHTEGR